MVEIYKSLHLREEKVFFDSSIEYKDLFESAEKTIPLSWLFLIFNFYINFCTIIFCTNVPYISRLEINPYEKV